MDRHAGSTGTTLVGRATTLLLTASLAAATLVTAVAVVTTATPAAVAASPPTGASAPSGTGGGGTLSLVSQTAWVGPDRSLVLRLGTRSSVAVADQALDVAVYPCLGSVSAFDQALSSPSGTPVAATHQPLALAPLLQGGVATLSMPVTTPGSGSSSSSSSASAGSGFTIALPDEPGQCGLSPSGVYPVRVQLVDTQGGTILGSLTTFLVYDDTTGQAAHRLLVAVTLPVQAAVAPARHPSSADLRADPSSGLTTPSASRQRALAATVAQLAAHPNVPVTVETSGQTLAGAGGSGATAARLAAATADDLTTTTYAPVDVTALTGAGLTDELVLQLARGAQAASGLTRATAAGGATTWVAHTPPTQGALDALAAAGIRQVVVPASSVAEAPTDGSTAQPFTVTGGSTALTAVAANGDLGQRMAAAASAPALAAQELAAEAAQMYFEKPNDSTARGVAAVAPAGWTAPAPFTAALLQALDGNPLLQPVTVSTLTATVPTDSACRSSCRLTNTSPSGAGLPAGAIRAQRARVAELETATVGVPALAPALGDLVLAGESDLLRPAQQHRVLANASDAVSAQLDQVSVSGERTITLTSQQGTLPVTIVSTAPYSIRATVSLASDKLLFDNRLTSWTVPGPVTLLGHGHNNVVLVPVETRTPGLFTVDITLRVPSGTLEVATGQITVRSSATSIVGIVLSVAALVVLVVWWIRTSRRRRAQRRADEAGLAP